MNASQISLYWREWAALRRWCLDHGVPVPDRHEVHRRALGGQDASSRALTNPEFDKILAAFRAISQPDSLLPQLRAGEQPRRRLLWRIERMAPPNYTAAVAHGKFGTDDLQALDASQLTQLRNTLAARQNSLRRKQRQADRVTDPF